MANDTATEEALFDSIDPAILADVAGIGLGFATGMPTTGYFGTPTTGLSGATAGFHGSAQPITDAYRVSNKPNIFFQRGAYTAPHISGAQPFTTRSAFGTTPRAGTVTNVVVPKSARSISALEPQSITKGSTFDKGKVLAKSLEGGKYPKSASANALRAAFAEGGNPALSRAAALRALPMTAARFAGPVGAALGVGDLAYRGTSALLEATGGEEWLENLGGNIYEYFNPEQMIEPSVQAEPRPVDWSVLSREYQTGENPWYDYDAPQSVYEQVGVDASGNLLPGFYNDERIPGQLGPALAQTGMEPSGAATSQALSQLDLDRAEYERKRAMYDAPQMLPLRDPEGRILGEERKLWGDKETVTGSIRDPYVEKGRLADLGAWELADQDEEDFNKRQHLDLVYDTGIRDTSLPVKEGIIPGIKGALRGLQEYGASKLGEDALKELLYREDNIPKVNKLLNESEPDIVEISDSIRDLVLNQVYTEAKDTGLTAAEAYALPNVPTDRRDFEGFTNLLLGQGRDLSQDDIDIFSFGPSGAGLPKGDRMLPTGFSRVQESFTTPLPELDESRMLASVGDDPASAFRFDAATPVSQALQGIFPQGAPTSLIEEAQPPRSLPIGTPGWQPDIPAQTLVDPALEQAITHQYNPAEFGLDPFTREQVGTSSNFLANLMAEGTEAQKTAIQRAISPRTSGILRENLAAHFARDDAESPFMVDPSTGETYEFASRAPVDMANIMRAINPNAPSTGVGADPGIEIITEPTPTVEPSPLIGDPGFTPSLGGYTIAPSGPVVGEAEQPIAQAVAQALANTDQPVQQNLQALVELAQTDPSIAERYVPGSQALQDITSEVDSFSAIRDRAAEDEREREQVRADNQRRADEAAEKAEQAQRNRAAQEKQAERARAIAEKSQADDDNRAAARAERNAERAAEREREAAIERKEADARQRATEEAARQREIAKAAEASRKAEAQRAADERRRAAEQRAALDAAAQRALQNHMAWMATQAAKRAEEERLRALRGYGSGAMWT